jgi:hypothetical protein
MSSSEDRLLDRCDERRHVVNVFHGMGPCLVSAGEWRPG